MPPATGPDQRRLYNDLAWLWPIISPPEDYVDESEAFSEALLERAQRPISTLLHLGCGGGHNDFTLKRRFQVTGVDISAPMVALARSRNPDASYVHGDMRTVRLGRRFDAVLALDAINYIATDEDLRAVFSTAYQHLESGGVFLTYAEQTVERFEQNKTVGASQDDGSVNVTFVENLYDANSSDTTYEGVFVYFIRHHGELEIEIDRHLFGLFPEALWTRLLVETGFQVYQFEYSPPDRNTIPIFVCVKPA